ncbi:MAG: hypothetical protein M1829_003557 [Trizodia sp. TS-e1964]|nr:MAG: hypothetical protein M1829_003557 [Trizodia sp. TS-e1964]
MANDESSEASISLQDQRVFGAGLKRKQVNFVPSSTISTLNNLPQTKEPRRGLYQSLLPPRSPARLDQQVGDPQTQVPAVGSSSSGAIFCQICNLPFEGTFNSERAHEASIAHQVCLAHSLPPSHIDRSRPGLKYLSGYGWDPDSRLGLGVSGTGILAPLKAKSKNDTLGIGFKIGKQTKLKKREAPSLLNAKQVRKLDDSEKRKRLRLQESFYGNEDVDKYLNSNI